MTNPIPWLMNGLFTRFTADELTEIVMWLYQSDGTERIMFSFFKRFEAQYPAHCAKIKAMIKEEIEHATLPKL